jgi:hypothetical protein
MVVSKYTGISIGFGIMITDFIIISASGFAFRQLEAPLYGYIVLFISTKVIDMILEGWNYSKLVIITSNRTVEIEKFILNTLERSGTALKSRSLYLNREGEIIRRSSTASSWPNSGTTSRRSIHKLSSSSTTPMTSSERDSNPPCSRNRLPGGPHREC